MQQFTEQAQQTINNLAQRYGASPDAVSTLMYAVLAGGGTMAQFSHPELGGSGQWMQGGMTMVSDMFNHNLQAKVSGLCAELSSFMASHQVFVPPPAYAASGSSYGQTSSYGGMSWWPSELGQPSSSGGQNDFRYAYFPGPRRLAVESAGQLRIYDTLDHQIGGVSQQQSGMGSTFTFSSQYGQFTVESLPLVQPQWQQTQQAPAPLPQEPLPPPPPPPIQAQFDAPPPFSNGPAPVYEGGRDDVFAALDRLGNLRDRGILTEDEFLSKKRELLARL